MDTLMAVGTDSGFWAPFLIFGGIVLAIFGGFRGRAFLLVTGLAIGVTDGLVVSEIKKLAGRPRPFEMIEGVRTIHLAKSRPKFLALTKPLEESLTGPRIQPPTGRSFPSGHAANNFVVAVCVALFYRRWGWVAFLPATLVAYSRVYTGVHWPSDVVISAFLGTGTAILVVAACEWVWRKYAHKLPGWISCGRTSLLSKA